MIDRYLLRYFLAVIDHGNFSRAAAACNVSQPTLSIGIAKLEERLGRSLIKRTSRRIELTEAGVLMARHARRIEAEFAIAEREVQDAEEAITPRLGVLLSLPSTWMEAFLARMVPEAGRHKVEILEGRERDLLDRLSRGRIDAALSLVRPAETRYDHETLFTEGYALALAATHPLADRPVIEAEELADSPMIVRRHCELLSETSRFFTARGVRPAFTARTFSDDRAMQYVKTGLGITVMPDCFRGEGIARPKLKDFHFERQVGLLFAGHRDREALLARPSLRTLVDTIAARPGRS